MSLFLTFRIRFNQIIKVKSMQAKKIASKYSPEKESEPQTNVPFVNLILPTKQHFKGTSLSPC